MLWTRKHAPETLNPGRFIVHGHTPLHSERPEQHPHRLNLDTGAVYGGRRYAEEMDAPAIGDAPPFRREITELLPE